MKRLLVLIAVVLFAAPLFAKLSKYKGWESSPEGYFMTKAEHEQWSKIDNDTDADKFIADFRAKRPDNFQKEVADRAANADKYLTVGKTQGSKSIRGKIVILFGPPSHIDVAEKTVANSEKHDNPIVAGLMSNMNAADSGGGGRSGDSNNSVGNSMSTSTVVRIMHFNYQGPIAKTVDRKQIDVNVDIDPDTGKDRMESRGDESDLNTMFEIVAQSWIKK